MMGIVRDSKGSVLVETLISILVPIFFFFTTWQLADLLTAQLIIKHAAVVAARAAIVVGPDDPRFYGGQGVNDLSGGTRLDDVKNAAALVLAASPHFASGGFSVNLQGSFAPGGTVTATVAATYPCFSGWLNAVCGFSNSRILSGIAVLPYQGAGFPYDSNN
jgi:hypothetical protein